MLGMWGRKHRERSEDEGKSGWSQDGNSSARRNLGKLRHCPQHLAIQSPSLRLRCFCRLLSKILLKGCFLLFLSPLSCCALLGAGRGRVADASCKGIRVHSRAPHPQLLNPTPTTFPQITVLPGRMQTMIYYAVYSTRHYSGRISRINGMRPFQSGPGWFRINI